MGEMGVRGLRSMSQTRLAYSERRVIGNRMLIRVALMGVLAVALKLF